MRHAPAYLIVLIVLVGLGAAACLGGGSEAGSEDPTSTVSSMPPVVTESIEPTARPAATALPGSPTIPAVPESTVTVVATMEPLPTNTPGLAASATQSQPSTTPVPADGPVIVLDPAHDPTAPGALGTEYREVLTTALYTKAALEEAGYIVYLTRYDNDTINQENPEFRPPNAGDFHPGYSRAYAQASAALQYDPDLVIVLHYNGIGDSSVGGIEVYYCERGSDQNIVLASIVLDELVTAFRGLGYEPPRARIIEDIAVARGDRHFPSLGNVYEYPRTWLENRYDHIPVVLTEPLYMTNPTEYALLSDPSIHMALADAYVRAVDRYFGR